METFLGFDHLFDVRIHTEDGFEFSSHRVLLAMKSEYFHNLFCTEGVEDAFIFVRGIAGPTMKIIIDYLYTERLNLIDHDIQNILVAAHFLGIDHLLQNFRALASRDLNTSNCIHFFLAAYQIENLDILRSCSRFIIINFESIIRDPKSKFEDLPLKFLEQFLALDNLRVSNEDQIWKAIIIWINKDLEQRKTFLRYLIQYIRFCEAKGDLISEVLDHPMVLDNPRCNQIKKVISYGAQSCQYRIPIEFYFITKLYITPSDYSEGIKLYVTYDENIDFWRYIGSKMFRPDVILHGSGSLIMMFDTNLNIIYTFDIISKRWTQLVPPLIPRTEYNVVKLGHYVYVMGGILPSDDHQLIVTAVERYNIDSGQWEFSKPHYGLAQEAIAVIDNCIYVIGTFSSFHDEVILVQFYNPNTDCWSSVNSPNIFRRQFAHAVYRNELYVLGGHSNNGFLKSVEVYDTREDTWKESENLPFAYFLPRAVVIKDTLFVYENNSDDFYNYRCPPVFWDDINKNWCILEASSSYRDLHMYHFCVIDDPEVIKRMRYENRHSDTKWSKSSFFHQL